MIQQKDQLWFNRKSSLYEATEPQYYLSGNVYISCRRGAFCEAENSEKEGKMEKKYLKKVLTGLSIAGLVTGISGLALSASG